MDRRTDPQGSLLALGVRSLAVCSRSVGQRTQHRQEPLVSSLTPVRTHRKSEIKFCLPFYSRVTLVCNLTLGIEEHELQKGNVVKRQDLSFFMHCPKTINECLTVARAGLPTTLTLGKEESATAATAAVMKRTALESRGLRMGIFVVLPEVHP